ncbi:unnamed protein product, partial [Phaeothamnion confervicola]
MALAALTRLAVAAVIITFTVTSESEIEDCEGGSTYRMYLWASVVACLASAASEAGVAVTSFSSTIMYLGPRAGARRFLVLKSAAFALQVALAVVGVFLCGGIRAVCGSTPPLLLTAALLATISQVLDCAGVGCCLLTLSAGRPYVDVGDDGDARSGVGGSPRRAAVEVEAEIEDKCRSVCNFIGRCTCYLFSSPGANAEADFQHVARVIAKIFYTEEALDVVPSDVAAGIVLLHHVQKNREYALREDFESILHEEGLAGGGSGGGGGGGSDADLYHVQLQGR